jgi:hypothetical protein
MKMKERKSSMKKMKQKIGDETFEIVKGKSFTETNSPCAVCSKGSLVSKKGTLKKKKEKTCYSRNALLKIAEAYSDAHPNDKINTQNINSNKLWNMIRNKLSGICGYDEYCWRKQDFVKRLKDAEIELFTFKTKYPDEWKKNRYTWLNTYDILYVMKQYEKIHDDFVFLGVPPSDCPTKIHCELSNIDIPKMVGSGIRRMGVIFNLDTSQQNGSHWVGFYSEFNKKKAQLNYYDSYGEPPIPLIAQFMNHLATKFEKNGIQPTLMYNDKRHQYGGSECGVFSMNFLLERLGGTTMYDISQMDILDKDMNYLRQILYTMKD